MADLLLVAEQLKDFTNGVGAYARTLVRGLAARGHRLTVLVPEEQAADEPAEIVPLPIRSGNLTPFGLRGLRRLVGAAIAEHAPRHELIHFLDARWAALLPPEPLGRPVAGSVHDVYALDWLDPAHPRGLYRDRWRRGGYYRWLRRLERRVYRRTDLLFANSDHVAGALRDGYDVPADRVRVVRLSIPEAPPAAPAALPGDPAVLFVGGNYQRKGLGVLLAAVAAVAREHPGLHLTVVGRDPRRRKFEAMAARAGIGGRVSFSGWRGNDEVRAMMAGATIFAMPSFVEAFGLVYLEAMRAGAAVIATTAGGAAECFRDGEDALLVPPADVETLAAALHRLSVDAELRRRLVEGGRRVLARLTPAAMVAGVEAAYAELLLRR